MVLVGDNQAGSVLVHGDLGGPAILLLEVASHSPKLLHRLPARANGARAAHSMTLTDQLHVFPDSLEIEA